MCNFCIGSQSREAEFTQTAAPQKSALAEHFYISA